MADDRHPYPTITPHLGVTGAEEALAFYAAAFGARELIRLKGPAGEVVHAEMLVGDALVTLGEASDAFQLVAPDPSGPVQVAITWFDRDVDKRFARAVEAGATEVSPPTDQFHGDRVAVVRCPFGHRWILAERVRDVPHADQQRLLDELYASTPTE